MTRERDRDGHASAVVAAPVPPADWGELLRRAPQATFFHAPLWTKALCRHVSGLSPSWLAVRRAGRLVGGMVAVRRRRGPCGVLLNHYLGTTGGPLVDPALPLEDQDAVAAALLTAFARLGERRGTLAAAAVLSAESAARWGLYVQRPGWRRCDQPYAVLPLTGGLAAVEREVFPKHRREERDRALSRGCVAGVTADPAILTEYYPIYLAATRRWGIAPVPVGLLRELLVSGGGAVFLSWVRHEGRIIGAHVCFQHGDEVTPWNGVTLPEHKSRFPATLLIWTDIEEACRRGAARLDLGGNLGIASLANFKERLGARTETRVRYERASAAWAVWLRLRAVARAPWVRRGNA